MNLSWLQQRRGPVLAWPACLAAPPRRRGSTPPPPWIVPGLIRGGRSGHGGHLLLLLLVPTILVTRGCPAPGPGPCRGWWWSWRWPGALTSSNTGRVFHRGGTTPPPPLYTLQWKYQPSNVNTVPGAHLV